MGFSIGIVGLPNVGKSTLFKALTRNKVDIAPYPFTTIHPNVGVVAVPDERLKKIAEIIKPEKITPTIIEFLDIAGLVKGAYRGEGLGNQFLGQIRNCDAILEVVRGFHSPEVEHVEGEINPIRDIEIVQTELLMKDLEILEGLIQKKESDAKTKDKKTLKKIELFKKLKEEVSKGKKISHIDLSEEEKEEIKEFRFLTEKPVIYILNSNNHQEITLKDSREPVINLNAKIEEEISELSEAELKEMEIKSQLDQVIIACYNILNLITFYTVTGGKETRAWTLKNGSLCPKAGGVVHSDFEEKFIRADVIPWQALIEAGGWNAAREKGWIKTVGKDYPVKDGDVIEFRI
jgi:hypothetical protein